MLAEASSHSASFMNTESTCMNLLNKPLCFSGKQGKYANEQVNDNNLSSLPRFDQSCSNNEEAVNPLYDVEIVSPSSSSEKYNSCDSMTHVPKPTVTSDLPVSAQSPSYGNVRIGHPKYDIFITFDEMKEVQSKMYKRKDGLKIFDYVAFSNKLLRSVYTAEYLSMSGIQLDGRHCLKGESKLLAVIDEINRHRKVQIEPDNPTNDAWKQFRQNVNALCRRCRFETKPKL